MEDQNSTLIIEGESPSLLPVPSSLIPQHSAAATECHPTVERKEDEEETDQGKPEATFKVGFQSRKVIQQIGEIEVHACMYSIYDFYIFVVSLCTVILKFYSSPSSSPC